MTILAGFPVHLCNAFLSSAVYIPPTVAINHSNKHEMPQIQFYTLSLLVLSLLKDEHVAYLFELGYTTETMFHLNNNLFDKLITGLGDEQIITRSDTRSNHRINSGNGNRGLKLEWNNIVPTIMNDWGPDDGEKSE